MRFHYLVYPEAKEKLQPLELEERFKEAEKTEEGLPFFGTHIMAEEVVGCVNDMKERGYFKTLPKEEGLQFKTQLDQFFQNLDKYSWRVERRDKIIKEKADLHDLLLMTGWVSSLLLKPEENWDYKKFGFESLSNFIGSAGAMIWQLGHGNGFRQGYKWKSKSHDDRVWINEVTGDTHLDLRIYKTDVTPDKTFDPLENKVLYRPELDDDRKVVAGYHSTESELLVSLLKYVHQQNIPSEIVKDKGRSLIDLIRSRPQIIGNATECFDRGNELTSFGENPDFLFSHFDILMPVLDKNYSTEKRTVDVVPTPSKRHYGIYVGPEKELIFSYEKIGKENKSKSIDNIFYPEEIDHLITGVFYQSVRGLGRTAPNKLIRLLEYRFSDEFEKDQKFWKIKP